MKTVKKDFSKFGTFFDIPNLLSIQLDSFREFLQYDTPAELRKKEGLQAVFNEVFPIEDTHRKFTLEFVSYIIGNAKYTPEETLQKGVNYSVPVKVNFRLIRRAGKDQTKVTDVIEDEVFLCELPFMTTQGTFIINGVERVIVSQLHRSPGIYFSRDEAEFSALLVPLRGAWFEVVVDKHGNIVVLLDRTRRISAATFLRALGFSDEDIFRGLFRVEEEPVRLGQIIAAKVVGPEGEIYARSGETVTEGLLEFLISKGVKKISCVSPNEIGISIVSNTVLADKTTSEEEALKKIYYRLRSMVPHSVEVARNLIVGILFDKRRFNLGKVGRFKLNQRLGKDISLAETALRRDDIIGIFRHLLNFVERQFTADDVDHLANRRVKRVGELLEDQFRYALMQLGQNIRERAAFIDEGQLNPQEMVNTRVVVSAIMKFFTQSQLCQFMEQTNPLTELTHKRRVSALGPGGLTKETAGFEARDVHYSHYGRICPIETPEGPNIGLISTVATFAKIDQFGFMTTPYWRVKDGVVTKKIEYLTPDDEDRGVIAQANTPLDEGRKFATNEIIARKKGDVVTVRPEMVTHMDVSPKQLFAPSTVMVPFLEHDDADRALMGSNMQRQAVPLLEPGKPLVGTGVEGKFALESGALVKADEDGVVAKVDASSIVLRTNTGLREYRLWKFKKSNQYTCWSQRPIVADGQKVEKGDVLADGPSTQDGQLALGQNVFVAFMCWRGYNYEDAIVVSERIVKDDHFTSIQILEFEIQARETKLGPEEITRDIPGAMEEELKDLDEFGIIRLGTEVTPGDILVGRITPKGETEFSPEERLLRAIFGEKAANVRDTSLRVEPGVFGVVIERRISSRRIQDALSRWLDKTRMEDVENKYHLHKKFIQERRDERLKNIMLGEKTAKTIKDGRDHIILKTGEKFDDEFFSENRLAKVKDFEEILADSKKNNEINQVHRDYETELTQLNRDRQTEFDRIQRGDELPHGVLIWIRIFIAQKRKLSVGDKMAGRHGNKGVVAKVLPAEDMPYLPDGTPVDMVLNPLGVPSRMNIGQILETYLGWAAKILGYQAICPVFEGATPKEIKDELSKAGLPEDGKVALFDGRTGMPFYQKVVVGYMYMMKLVHMVDDKIHARSTGRYSLITQQPLGGKAQFGGQRFGEMEVWALEAYGAANALQEMLTVKSDDVEGRSALYEALIRGKNPPSPKAPASFSVLVKELQGLGLELIPEKEGMTESDFSDFDALRLRIASPEIIRSWSSGEVTKAETINYRTQKPERDGLFCERIFGPVKDYECNCGKYKKLRYKGIVCDRCGVEVTTSTVRRERMGHIELVVPVAHPIFYQITPSKVGLILDLSINQIESVLNYENYIILETGASPYKKQELISEEEYNEVANKYEGMVADMGAPALKYLLSKLELDDLAAGLRARIKLEKSRRFNLLRRLRVVEAFRNSQAKPDWMILDVLPVIPPDLRPLVPLEGGRYATSDLNDLYKRVIVRNNRLKHLLSIKTPEIILKNEKRMLQDAVDSLFNNENRPRPVRGKANRPLKSLCEALRGKQGRFRRNLLGKRVDYSGRSVIVVDPNLKLSQCSIPKEMALELFKPMILRKLEEKRLAESEKGARSLYKKEAPAVWEVLEEVTKMHPIMLNRAPTLHRVSVQSFFPVLSEHRAIGIHPLVCPPFNADFDGDTMSVHVPLTPEAILEAAVLMLSNHNILSPAHGRPLMTPSQDIVAGIYYLTKSKIQSTKSVDRDEAPKVFDSFDEVNTAYVLGDIDVHMSIRFFYQGKAFETTVGRVLFNEILPESLRFANEAYNKEKLASLVNRCYRLFGSDVTSQLLDGIKSLGFEISTTSGLSIGIDDVILPKEKSHILKRHESELKKVYNAYARGLTTESEKYNQVVNTWTMATAEVEEALMKNLSEDQDGFNPMFMLIDSGARGSRTQAAQICGMRGLMAKPQRRAVGEEVIETPIKSSFLEGLSVWEYFISTHGARKGLTDTALKTAEAGYLMRRLVDVAHDVVITMEDCGTILGQEITALREGSEVVESIAERISGRIALDDIKNPLSGEVIVHSGEEITEQAAEEIENFGIEKVRVRSVLTCEAPTGLCVKCYGRNLATGRLVEIGEAVGIIAAQSIGEPGTQLTLKTFHVGGVASRIAEQTKATAKFSGQVKFQELKTTKRSDGEIVALDSGRLVLTGDGKVLPLTVPRGVVLRVGDGEEVTEGATLFEWEPYSIIIMAAREGRIKYEDIRKETLREDIDEATQRMQRIIVADQRGELHPRIEIVSEGGRVIEKQALPIGAYLLVNNGDKVLPGDTLAKLMREIGKTRDITGGLPKVAELVEAKRIKEPAIISEIEGDVEVGEPKMGVRIIKVTSEGGTVKEYDIPYGKYLLVTNGNKVKAGDKLCEGSVDPHDVLRVKGWLAVQEFLTNQIQAVYRLQNVKINDKHISVIVRQVLRKVKIEDPGDSVFTEGEIVERRKVYDENQRLAAENLRPASYQPILLGITRASLLTESFLSAASFQETTRVLSEAAIQGRVDRLHGLKENVIVGRLIPAGTGFREFLKVGSETEEEKKTKAV